MAIDFRIRDFFYPISILKLRSVLEQTQWMPLEELRAYQERKLASVLRQAYCHVPYYRETFQRLGLRPSDIRYIDDLKKLPLLGRETVRKRGASLRADNARRFHPRIYKTSGTSGQSLEFCLDKGANTLEFVYYWRHWGWAGFRLGDPFAELGSQYFLARKKLDNALYSWQPYLRRLMLNGSQVSHDLVEGMARAIRRYRPKFLKGMASTLYYFALCLKEAGIDDLSFKAVFSTGETFMPQYRTMVEGVFKGPVLDSYGHMERTVAISQCLEGGYHINSDYGIMELDHAEASAREKTIRGNVVGTSLYNLSMPFIRYDVGDHAEIFLDKRSCPCGRTLPLAKTIHGRREDTVVTPDGRFITSMFLLPDLIEGIHFVQFIQESKTRLCINLVPGEAWNGGKEGKLCLYTRKLVGPDMKIRIRSVTPGDLLRDAPGKYRTVISQVKASG